MRDAHLFSWRRNVIIGVTSTPSTSLNNPDGPFGTTTDLEHNHNHSCSGLSWRNCSFDGMNWQGFEGFGRGKIIQMRLKAEQERQARVGNPQNFNPNGEQVTGASRDTLGQTNDTTVTQKPIAIVKPNTHLAKEQPR